MILPNIIEVINGSGIINAIDINPINDELVFNKCIDILINTIPNINIYNCKTSQQNSLSNLFKAFINYQLNNKYYKILYPDNASVHINYNLLTIPSSEIPTKRTCAVTVINESVGNVIRSIYDQDPYKKCVVLSLGNSITIGGGYQRGALGAQEETLCNIINNLFPSLQTDSKKEQHNNIKFPKLKLLNNRVSNCIIDVTDTLKNQIINLEIDEIVYNKEDWYTDNIKYSKDMKLFRNENIVDNTINKPLYPLRSQADWIPVDIITAASRNFAIETRTNSKGEIKKKYYSNNKEVDDLVDGDFAELFKNIIYTICKSADLTYPDDQDHINKPKILILGALGAGVFAPNFFLKYDTGKQYFQEKIAAWFYEVLNNYVDCKFERIIFAITDDDTKPNSLPNIFNRQFNGAPLIQKKSQPLTDDPSQLIAIQILPTLTLTEKLSQQISNMKPYSVASLLTNITAVINDSIDNSSDINPKNDKIINDTCINILEETIQNIFVIDQSKVANCNPTDNLFNLFKAFINYKLNNKYYELLLPNLNSSHINCPVVLKLPALESKNICKVEVINKSVGNVIKQIYTDFPTKKCLVLSLGNSSYIGGGYQRGALGAQEETLCNTIINLFPSLQKTDTTIMSTEPKQKSLLNNRVTRCIDTTHAVLPNLIIAIQQLKTDEIDYKTNDWYRSYIKYSQNMKLFRDEHKPDNNKDTQLYPLRETDTWIDVDIITAASKNFGGNTCDSQTDVDNLFNKEGFKELFKRIIYTICTSADSIYKDNKVNKPKILILGALGAGVFAPKFTKNYPKGTIYFQTCIATLFQNVLNKYGGGLSFERIIFAITGSMTGDKLPNIFNKIFNPVPSLIPASAEAPLVSSTLSTLAPSTKIIFEHQDKMLSCGRHAINNIIQDDTKHFNIISSEQTIDLNNPQFPINMITLCDIATNYIDYNVGGEPLNLFECNPNENYTTELLRVALALAGYKFMNMMYTLNKVKLKRVYTNLKNNLLLYQDDGTGTGTDVDVEITENDHNSLGYLINLGEKHWTSGRKINNNYYYFDSLQQQPIIFTDIDTFFNYIINISNIVHITIFKYTGISTNYMTDLIISLQASKDPSENKRKYLKYKKKYYNLKYK